MDLVEEVVVESELPETGKVHHVEVPDLRDLDIALIIPIHTYSKDLRKKPSIESVSNEAL